MQLDVSHSEDPRSDPGRNIARELHRFEKSRRLYSRPLEEKNFIVDATKPVKVPATNPSIDFGIIDHAPRSIFLFSSF